jgi:molybdopterin-guanine dinucleotide biosynthesis protein MobB
VSKSAAVPILGFAAWSGTGKTTLLRALMPQFRQVGIRVGVVKHAHHEFDIDIPGKDSYELRRAGAAQVLVGSRKRWALVVETELEEDPSLADMLAHLSGDELDLILVEGLKREAIPKIELHRPSMGRPLICLQDPRILAVATDAPVVVPQSVVMLDLNDIDAIIDFILQFAGLRPNTEKTVAAAIGSTS